MSVKYVYFDGIHHFHFVPSVCICDVLHICVWVVKKTAPPDPDVMYECAVYSACVCVYLFCGMITDFERINHETFFDSAEHSAELQARFTNHPQKSALSLE